MENDLLDSIVKAYFAQINSALKISEIVSSHGGEEELSPDSIIIGLIYRLMVPMTNENLPPAKYQPVLEDLHESSEL